MHWAQKIAIAKEAREAGAFLRDPWDLFTSTEAADLRGELKKIHDAFSTPVDSTTKYRTG